jgi:RNA polymerase sigma factor (sigma-70 family)
MTQETAIADEVSSLVSRCKKGDKEAFHRLYDLHARAMLNVSMRVVNNRHDAEDILQEAFLSAFGNIGKFTGKSSFGSWLKRIVINRSIDFIRKRKLNLVSMDENFDAPETEEMPGVVYEIETVRECIKELPDGYRIVLSLYLFEDYSHKEIADTLGITEGTSKSQYKRAKEKLKQLISQKSLNHE